MDFAMKFKHIVSYLRNLGEAMEEKEVVRQFLRVTPTTNLIILLSPWSSIVNLIRRVM